MGRRLASRFEQASFLLFLATLAWAPFPLGSNRPWSWSLLSLLISVSWLLWLCSIWSSPSSVSRIVEGLKVPLALGALALLWGVVQVLPIVPQSWTHPVWQMAGDVLSRKSGGIVSLNGWRTETELMKLVSYAMAFWLARVYGQRSDRARTLLTALVVIGAAYAAYAGVLASLKTTQFNLFYAVAAHSRDVSGPFVNRNNFATYCGLIALVAGARLIESSSGYFVSGRGVWRTTEKVLQYAFSQGLFYAIAGAMALTMLFATGSRAGTIATFAGIVALFLLTALGSKRDWRWIIGISLTVAIGLAALIAFSGGSVAARLDDMAVPGDSLNLRLTLWDTAIQMIHDAPLLGLGLGTFEYAYPLYSDGMTVFVMDRVHNDYLEFAAGLGLPAAILWWSALIFLVGLCARGTFVRRRNRSYPTLAVAASVLVGVHAIFDFSLQIPAIALTYAVIFGLGVAQSFSTRRGANE